MNGDAFSRLRLGTSAWSNSDWVGVFYPPGTKSADFLAHYAQRYNCVEVDSTFYRVPSAAMIKKWVQDTPANFIFAAKVPRVITHEKRLKDCQEELSGFLQVMDGLGEKLGPLLLQFPYFNKSAFASGKDFLARLETFIARLPANYQWVVEIRNKYWVTEPFLELLRKHAIAYAIIDQSWMPRIDQLLQAHDPITADFAYIRWLGDRQGIESITTRWEKVVVDRYEDLTRWVAPVKRFIEKSCIVYGFFNNHYAGHAPASLEMFKAMLAVS